MSRDTYRLPETWRDPEVVEDVFVADDLAIHRAGLSTIGPSGEEVCGAAAGLDGPTTSRAWFELLERVSGLEAIAERRASYELLDDAGRSIGTRARAEVFPESSAPERWQYARSNGVAIHVDWPTASRRALWELAERDRILRSWHGDIAPCRVAVASTFARAKSFEWVAYSFPELDEGTFSAAVEVAGVFGFPKTDDAPFVLGFAGRGDLAAALAAAEAEALQQLAFLWGEPLPDVIPPMAPSAAHHLDAYQVRGAHEVIRRWLEGKHLRYARGARVQAQSRVAFVDLTPPWLPAGLRVAKAVCEGATPLVFGDAPSAAHLPDALRLHPIA